MSLDEFTNLATSLDGDKKLVTPKQMAEFVMIAKQCAEHQTNAEDEQTVAEYASGATSRAHELCDSDHNLDAVHVALLELEVEYDPAVIKSEWANISTLLEPYLAGR